MSNAEPIINIRNVYKFFGQLAALNNICLDIYRAKRWS
jgi:ABC-type sugar transport system ATPase subunit